MNSMQKFNLALIALFFVTSHAYAQVGTKLDEFVPSPSGNGRGITIKGPTSTSAYYSTYGSEDKVYLVDLKTHVYQGTLDTDLETIDPGRDYGALAWNPTTSRLWSARYSSNMGKIGWIDPNTGHITQVFDAHDSDAKNIGVDGLAVDSDGSLWASADGLTLLTTTLFHFDIAGNILGSFDVPFGNSGIAIDGDDLWLANIDGRKIHKYSKVGVDSGINFSTPSLDPEGLTIDYCSFQGKKAVWLYSAGIGGGAMAAFEIGASSNTGCPATATPTPTPTATPTRTATPISTPTRTATPTATFAPNDPRLKNPVDKKPDDIFTGSSPLIVALPITFHLCSPLDPNGTIFIYIWNFGDGSSIITGPYGQQDHTYRCGGFYSVRGSIIESGGRQTDFLREIVVDLPSSVIKKYKGLQMSPAVRRLSTDSIKARLDTKKIGKTKPFPTIQGVDYKVDKKSFKNKSKSGVKTKIKINTYHQLTIKVHLQYKKTKKIQTIQVCFYM